MGTKQLTHSQFSRWSLLVLHRLLLHVAACLQLLLSKPMDLKAAMQAISGGASPKMASIIINAMKMTEAAQGECIAV
jgi:hypothetical protein